jgi:hypothetical protein
MKALDPALVAHLGARGQINARVLLWFHATLISNDAPAPWGVWTGDDDRTFTIDGQPRTYFGAGAMGAPGDLTFETGYVVRILRAQLAHFHTDVADRLALTNLRLARCDLHQIHMAPGSHDLIAAPLLKFRGVVETVNLPRPAQGQSGMADVQMASSARDLTQPLQITKSNDTQLAVWPGDNFRKYNTAKGGDPWGE